MKISLEQAKQSKLFYVVTTGVIYHPKTKKCLILQRSHQEKVHPGLWGVVGGKMEWEELEESKISRWNHDVPNWQGLVDKSLTREAKEESNLVVGDPYYLENVVFIRPDGIPVVLIQFALRYKSGKVKIAPEFEDFAWVDASECKKYDLIEGISGEIKKTISLYS